MIAQNYADALFSIGKEEHKLDAFREQLKTVEDSLQKEPQFAHLLTHPKMGKEQKKEMLTSVYEKTVDTTVLNFMKLLVDKSRFSHIREICQAFYSLYHEEYQIEVAYVSTAVPLQEEDIAQLKQVLEHKIKKKTELVITVNKEMMAGIRVKIGDQVMDNSASARLANLKETVVRSEFTGKRGEGE